MTINIKKLKKESAILLVLAPFLFPTGLQDSSKFEIVYKLLYFWRVISCAICLIIFFKKSFFEKISKESMLLFICVVSIFFSTFIKDASISSFFSTWGGFFCFYVGSEYFLQKYKYIFIETIRKWLWFISLLNLLTMIVFPNGMFSILDKLEIIGLDSKYRWLWGFKNNLYNLILPFILFNFSASYIEKKNIFCKSNICALIISVSTALLSHSSTLVLAIILFCFIIICIKFKFVKRFMTVRNMGIFGVLLSVLIVFFNIQNMFEWLIVDILGKDLTLSTRTVLWGYAMDDIKESLVFGYGVQNATTFGLLRYSKAFSHCHNAILTLTYQGGVMAIFTYLIFYLYTILKKYEKNDLLSIFSCLLFIQLMFHISGSISGVGFFLLLLLINNCNEIECFERKEEC